MEEIGTEIIKDCQNGSAESFAAIVEMYERPIFSYLYKLSFRGLTREGVEDLVQEVFLKAYCNIHAFDLARGTRFSTWLYTIARNHCLSVQRKKTVDLERPDSELVIKLLVKYPQDWHVEKISPEPTKQFEGLIVLQIKLRRQQNFNPTITFRK